MYHYVMPRDKKIPNLHRLDIDSFKKQLDYFKSNYGFIDKGEFINSIRNKEKSNGVVLTFDDGLICHYKYVFKELKKRGLWGIFYIPTFPLKYGKILDVHRIHILLSNANVRQVYSYLIGSNLSHFFDKDKVDEFKNLTYLTQKNDQYSLSIKRILNYFIKYKFRNEIIDQLFKKFIKGNFYASDYYLNFENLKEMQSDGMIIGSHTENHMVMSRLSQSSQKKEIDNSFKFLEYKLGRPEIKTFCYPYGGFHTFTKRTQEILNKYGCEFSFNVEQRGITLDDLDNNIQALPRFDCNQYKHGKSSVN